MTLMKYWVGIDPCPDDKVHTGLRENGIAVYLASDIDPLLKAGRWTREKPTVPGWYWYKRQGGYTVVVEYRDGLKGFYDTWNGQFAGPILPPWEE